MENNYFDKIIRAKLENLEASKKAIGWELLQHRINADPELSTPADPVDPIDEIIKSKLEDTDAGFEPGSWAMMENMINADADLIPQMDDVVFDGIAYENLNDLETQYNPNHWELMAKRIHEEFSLHHRLYKYKVVEVSLMLLAIFTLFQFLPIDKISIQKKKNTPIAESPESNTIQQIATFPATSTLPLPSESQTNTQQIATNSIVSTTTSAASSLITSSTIAQAETPAASPTNNNVPPSFPDFSRANQVGSSVGSEAIIALSEINQKMAQAKLESTDTDEQSIEQNELAIAELLNLDSSPMDELTSDDAENLPDCLSCKRKKISYFRIGMMAAADLNYVMTPYDVKFSENSYAQLFAGYSGGFSFGFQRSRWELSSGILYSSKRYEPKQNVEYTGSLKDGLVGEGLKSAQLNIISVPLNIHFTYARNTKWHLYALGGSSANFAVLNHYDYKKFSVGSSRAGYVDPRILDTQNDEPESYDGLFEGGSLRDNLYYTLNVGVGAERYFTSRWSIFIQPVYQHSLFAKGLGPNGDRINSISIFAGAKATLR